MLAKIRRTRRMIFLGLPCLVIVILIMHWATFELISFFSGTPEPASDYGEFPFTLVYKKDNERIEIADTLVIEHEGTDHSETLGTRYKWTTYYKSSKTDPAHSISDADLVLYEGFAEEVGSVKIRFALGTCEYYMGLHETDKMYQLEVLSPGDIVIEDRKGTRPISDEELLRDYNIEIIEKSISPPLTKDS